MLRWADLPVVCHASATIARLHLSYCAPLGALMTKLEPLLERNAEFAATDVRKNTPRLPFLPHRGVYVVTCIDPRTDPADFLGIQFGEAIVARTVGGRVTSAVIQDLA